MELIKVGKDKYININLFSLTKLLKESINILGRENTKEIKEQIGAIWSSVLSYESTHQEVDLKNILISVDSPLAHYILTGPRKEHIKGIDAYLSFENIVSAYLSAVTTENKEMINNLEPLLKNRVNGFIDDIPFEIREETLIFIFENGSLESFLTGEVSIEEYALFENDNIRHLILQHKTGRK